MDATDAGRKLTGGGPVTDGEPTSPDQLGAVVEPSDCTHLIFETLGAGAGSGFGGGGTNENSAAGVPTAESPGPDPDDGLT